MCYVHFVWYKTDAKIFQDHDTGINVLDAIDLEIVLLAITFYTVESVLGQNKEEKSKIFIYQGNHFGIYCCIYRYNPKLIEGIT